MSNFYCFRGIKWFNLKLTSDLADCNKVGGFNIVDVFKNEGLLGVRSKKVLGGDLNGLLRTLIRRLNSSCFGSL